MIHDKPPPLMTNIPSRFYVHLTLPRVAIQLRDCLSEIEVDGREIPTRYVGYYTGLVEKFM